MAFYYPDGDGERRELETGGGTTYIDQTKAGSVIARGTISTAAEFAQVTSKAGELGDLWVIGFTNENSGIYTGDLLLYVGTQWQRFQTSLNRPSYSLPTASASTKGGVKIGSGLSISNEVLSANPPDMPTASESIKGGVIVGSGLDIDENGILSAVTEEYTLPTASAGILGGVKVGASMKMTDGVLDYELPIASSVQRGGFKLGDGLYMDGDRLCLLPQDDNNEKECSINIKNILKGAGGSSESTDWSGGTSGTTYGIPILSTTPSTVEGAMWLSV